jgi:peptidyl-prolyl cis-trans isomerase-like 3
MMGPNFTEIKRISWFKEVRTTTTTFLSRSYFHVYTHIKRARTHTGDPTGTGKGGESIRGGYLDDEFAPGLKHTTRGVVGMASRGPNTNGSQFYIAYKKLPHLDNVFSVIGRVIHGFDVLDVMERQPVKGKKFRPINDIIIKSVTIHANPFATSA